MKAPDDVPAPQGDYAVAAEAAATREGKHAPFRIVALEDLHDAQVETDLAETIKFWNDHQRLDSRLDLMTSSIAKRLEERTKTAPTRGRSLSTVSARWARLVAAATTLCQESAIRVPGGNQNSKGLPIKDVLTD